MGQTTKRLEMLQGFFVVIPSRFQSLFCGSDVMREIKVKDSSQMVLLVGQTD